VTSLVFAHFFGDKMAGMNWRHAMVLGVLLGLTAVIGDLIESLFKREAASKIPADCFPASAASSTCWTFAVQCAHHVSLFAAYSHAS